MSAVVVDFLQKRKEKAAFSAAQTPRLQVTTTEGGCQVVSLESRRVAVQTAELTLRMWLRRGDLFSHVTMRRALAGLLESEGLTRLDTRTFRVYLTSEEEGWVWIEPKRTVVLEACPDCGSDMRRWRYLCTQQEGHEWGLWSWGCKECGAVFNRWEVSE
ncbi:MAG: hypothetical protein H5U02_00130 [Clostridia bacterium]|nr:hypothetical protein [Clostridia bacterium]